MILQELKRIANKGVLFVLLILLVLNGLLYVSEQEQFGGDFMITKTERSTKKEFENIEQYDKIKALHEIYTTYYDYIEAYYAYDHENAPHTFGVDNITKINERYAETKDVEEYVYHYLAHRLLSDEVKDDEDNGGYKDEIDEILNRAIQLSNVSIYKKEGTFSYYNVRKTAYDFKPLLDVETKYVSERPYDSLLEYDWMSYLLAIFGLMVAFRAIQEKTNGMEQLIYSAKGGREKLAVARVISVFIIMLAATIIFYLETMLLCKLIYGNIGFWDASIQSNELLAHTCLLLNRAEFLALVIVAQAVGICIISALLILMFSVIRETGICVLGVSALVAVEGIFIRAIKGDSIWMLFRYVNIFTLINPKTVLIDYHNFGVGGFITDRMRTGVAFTAICFVVVLLLYMVVMWKLHPQRKQSIVTRLLEKVAERVRRITSGTPVWMKQMYKVVVSQRMVIVMIVLFIFAWEWQTKVKVTYADEHAIIHQYYKECAGDFSQKNIDYVNGLHKELDDTIAKIAELSAIENPDIFVQSDLESLGKTKELYEAALVILDEEIVHQQNLEAKGVSAVTLPQYSYDAFFGEQSSKIQSRYSLLAVLFAIVVAFGAFSFEKKNHSDVLLRSAANRRGFLVAQQISIFVMNLVGAAVIFGINFANLNKLYGLEFKGASVWNVRILSDFPFDTSITVIMVLLYLYRFVIMMAVSEFVVLISYHTNYYKSLAGALVLIIPYALDFVGVNMLNFVSVVRSMTMNDLILTYGLSIKTIIGGIFWMTLGVVSVVISSRKWEGRA